MYKETYKTALAGYETFWERTNTARPVLNMSYRLPIGEHYPAPASVNQQWLDEEYRAGAYRHTIANSGYLAEGVPMIFTNLGPGCFSACIGGKFTLAPNTVWFEHEPVVEDWENPPQIKLEEDSEMWQHMLRMQKYYASQPDIGFSMADLGGIMDIVASLRTTEPLLCDLYDYPDEVREFSVRVKDLWLDAFDQQCETLRRADVPYNSWMNIPSAKPWYPLQCDFCYMISPKQFEKFVLPELVDQVNHMPRSIYHLDGVGEVPHLDMLLDIDGLTGIQWVPGAGNAPLWSEKWFDMYRKIQDKKKNLVLLGGLSEGDMAGAERLIKSLDPTGVFISCGFSSREKAEEMLENIEKWQA
ncbi:MAG: hypothetical protein IJC71_01290 [Clostridia bacterium]|nr:hypothetical protein [Clostridia bacterium]